MKEPRRLAAIVSADVAGYSRLMGVDESGTLAALKATRREVVDPTIEAHGGRIVKTTGDGLLLEFPSVVDAVHCAIEVQTAMADRNAEVPEDRRLVFRLGINLGDIIIDGDDIFGDGVNVAARLQEIATPGGLCVSSRVHDDVRDRLDAQFHDGGERSLKNIARPVRVWRWSPGTAPPQAAPVVAPTVALPENPSIAVLPFTNMSGDPEQEYFADGISEDIITELSHCRSLFVIARNSTFTYKGKAVDVRQLSRELGVRYVLEGSVRKAGNRVRVTAQLIVAETGNHLWANRYDGALADIFDLQDRITESIVGAIQPSIVTAEIERSRRKRPESLIAYDYVLRALPHIWSLERSGNAQATKFLEQATGIEPTYPLALSLLAWCHAQRAVYNWTDQPARERDTALQLAKRAANLSWDDPMVLAVLGAAHTISREYDIAAVHLDRALSLDHNLAFAWNRAGWLDSYVNKAERAIERFQHAIRLSPVDPMNFNCAFGIGGAHFSAGRYAQAVEFMEKALAERPTATWIYRQLVPALMYAGQSEDARRGVELLRRDYPDLTVTNVRAALVYAPDTVDRIVEGLRLAGLPE